MSSKSLSYQSVCNLLIVGVVSDVNVRSLGEAPRDVVYQSYTQGQPLGGDAYPRGRHPRRLAPMPPASRGCSRRVACDWCCSAA
jgi:hypothetical protein